MTNTSTGPFFVFMSAFEHTIELLSMLLAMPWKREGKRVSYNPFCIAS